MRWRAVWFLSDCLCQVVVGSDWRCSVWQSHFEKYADCWMRRNAFRLETRCAVCLWQYQEYQKVRGMWVVMCVKKRWGVFEDNSEELCGWNAEIYASENRWLSQAATSVCWRGLRLVWASESIGVSLKFHLVVIGFLVVKFCLVLLNHGMHMDTRYLGLGGRIFRGEMKQLST